MPGREHPKQTWQRQLEIVKSLNAMYGGADKTGD